MPQWTDRIVNHPVHAEVDKLRAAIDDAAKKLPPEGDAISAHERLHTIASRLKLFLSGTDPALVHPNLMGTLHTYVQQQISEINAFAQNGNVAHLNNANSHADNILVHLGPLALIPAKYADPTQKSLNTIRDYADQALRELTASVAGLKSQATALSDRLNQQTAEIEAQKGRVDNAIAQVQQQFTQSEEARRSQFAQSEQQRAETARQAEVARQESSEQANNGRREAFDALMKEIQEDRTRMFAAWQTAEDERIAELDAQLNRATEIVGIISESGMIHGYQKLANKERVAARHWHWIATVSMAGLIGFAIWAFLETLGATMSWATFAGRGFVALTFGILAAYGARQADKHETVERRSRRLELELAALDPFLQSLPESERHTVKRQVADRLFGQPEIQARAADPTTGTVLDLLKMAIERLSPRQ